MKLSQKIIGISAVMLASISALAGVAIWLNATLGRDALDLYDKAFVGVHYAHKVQTGFATLKGSNPTLPITAEDDVSSVNTMLNNMDVVIERASNDEERTLAQTARKHLASLIDTSTGAEPSSLSVVGKDIKRVVQHYADDAFERRNTAEDTINRFRMVLGATALVTLLIMVGMAVLLHLSVSRPLGMVIRWVGQGDRIDLNSKVAQRTDEIGELIRTIVRRQQADAEATIARELEEQRTNFDAQEALRAEQARLVATTAEQQKQVVEGLARRLRALAEGSLDISIDEFFPEDYKRLRMDFNAAVLDLSTVMGDIRDCSFRLADSAHAIASGSDELARSTEQQAATLEQTAAAHDEITATVSRTLDISRQTARMVCEARTRAEASRKVVADTVAAIRSIEQSSHQITRIISVIDEIAFQTNLLALNAGVEAARAGDAGRGFAVVAQEVRALAQRSAEAAKEIKGLISSSSTQVGHGVKLVGETGKALGGIVDRVSEIDRLIAEISQSAQEQSGGLSEVNVAVNQMDQFTQQNAAMVEQATAAVGSLKVEAAALAQQVSRFRTSSGVTHRRHTPAATAPSSGRSTPAARPVARAGGGRTALAVQPAPTESWDEF